MPDLPKKDGRHCRVFQNTVHANNHDNFAPKGNIVATVPPGTGIMIMASDQVEVFDNTIEKNQTAGLSIVSYLITDKPIKDEKYDPFCEAIYVHDNRFATNGEQARRRAGHCSSAALAAPRLPDILYDGMVNPEEAVRRRAARRPGASASATTARPVSPTSTPPAARPQPVPARPARRRRSSATSRRTTASSPPWRPSRSRA